MEGKAGGGPRGSGGPEVWVTPTVQTASQSGQRNSRDWITKGCSLFTVTFSCHIFMNFRNKENSAGSLPREEGGSKRHWQKVVKTSGGGSCFPCVKILSGNMRW